MNHSFLGKIFSHTYRLFPMHKLLTYPNLKTFKKKKDLFFYMTTEYSRNTLAWYRKSALKEISLNPKLKRLNLIKYYKNFE